MNENLGRFVIFKTLGILACTVPPTVAILTYFPLWLGGSGTAVLSGVAVLLCTLAHVPLFRAFKRLFTSSATWAMWLFIFILFLLLSKITEQMTVIAFVGFISNSIGAILFKIGDIYRGDGA